MRGVRSFLLPLALLCAGVAPAQVTWRTDSLMNTWPVQQHMAELGSTAGRGVVRAVDTRNLYDDLKREAPSIPVFADSNVVLYADLYGEPLRDHFRVLLGVSEVYFPMIEKELVRQGLPADLKYLPMALSAMNSLAGSTNGRAGLWMLTYPVALHYGLQVTAAVDERHDDVKSTMAAGRYLMDLHARYKDWGLTIMAFTCGPANITRAQQRTGGATDYRTLYPHFTEEEQEVLPQLMAFIHLSAQAERLGVEPIAVLPWEPADTLTAERHQHLSTIAKVLEVPVARLQSINPTLCNDQVPVGQVFHLPRLMGERYVALRDSIPRTEAALAQDREKEQQVVEEEWTTVTVEKSIRYTVRSGDNLSMIAARHHVTVSQLKKWNGLTSDRINAGRKLLIKVKKRERIKVSEPEPQLPDEEGPTNQVPAAGADAHVQQEPTSAANSFTTYTVRSGDSLYTIAEHYPGISAQNLMELNGITAKIHPGQTLRIPQP
ncbi:MAG TPA: LysM peptidoglycan-binding domain-containing protein [Flavobacteriales bacterium]|nr:LysM peptidoglycan-binding domain-containing protein [Flavobacteriales bacterium]